MNEALDLIKKSILARSDESFFFVNADCINIAAKDSEYCAILRTTPFLFGDGIGIKIASIILDKPIIENINGTDLFPFLCDMCIENNFSIFLLGGKPGIAERMKDNLNIKYPALRITGFHHGYFNWEKDSDAIIKQINKSRADILLVAFGVPLQEKWIRNNARKITCPVKIGVGGLFDFNADAVPRAPLLMRKVGMEWLFRLIQEPRRLWKRYIMGNPLFILRTFKWKIVNNF